MTESEEQVVSQRLATIARLETELAREREANQALAQEVGKLQERIANLYMYSEEHLR